MLNVNECVEQFVTLLYYTRALKFEEKPDYNYVRQLLEETLPSSIPPYDWVQLRVDRYVHRLRR